MSTSTQPTYAKDSWQTPRNARTLRAFMALRNQEIGQRLKTLRETRGNPPQQTVAEEVGVSYRSLQAWEAGETKPNWTSLKKLADYFGVQAEWILIGDEAPQRVARPRPLSDAERLARVEALLELVVRMLRATLPADQLLAEGLARTAEELLDPRSMQDMPDTAPAAGANGS
jgi:DNA-binding XRE family transcriptional regulator